jgi:hypothetical protein
MVSSISNIGEAGVRPGPILKKVHAETMLTFLHDGWAVEMLGARAESDETGGKLPEKWEPFQQTQHKREGLFVAGRSTGHDPPMNKYLHPLDQPRRPFSTQLDLSQIVHGHWTTPQFFGEQVGRRNRILNGEIDPNATRW